MTGSVLHVHLAVDGGICVAGPDHPSSWVTLDDLRSLLDRHRGVTVELSGDPGAPLAAPAARAVQAAAGQVTSGPAPAETVRPHGSTALMAAAAYGALRLLDDLLARGAPLEVTDRRGLTALHHATARGQTEAAARLLDAGAAIEARTAEGKSPLWNAAAFGHPDTVRLLVDRGADPTSLGLDGVDARGWALVRGHDQVAAMLPANDRSLVVEHDTAVGFRRGERIPLWYTVVAFTMFLAGTIALGGRFSQDGDWGDVAGWLVLLAALGLPLPWFVRGERSEIPSLLVGDEEIDVAARRRSRRRIRLDAITAASVEGSADRPRAVRLEHAGATTTISLDGRPAVAVIELLHRRLAERGVALVGGWHLAFTEGSVDPVMHTSGPVTVGPDERR